MAKAAFNKKKSLFTSTLDLELRKKLVKGYILFFLFSQNAAICPRTFSSSVDGERW
jgi:hypothetical protein